MTREERDRLLASYHSGEIGPHERERLFTGALLDQELFGQLFEDEALNEALADPELRRAVMAGDPPRPAAWRLWWRYPVLAGLAASVVLLVLFVQPDWRAPEPPGRAARAIPAPVTSIEPVPSPLPDTLELAAPAAVPPRVPPPRPEAPPATATEAAAPVALALRNEAAAAPPPFAARIEARRPGGEWQAAPPGEALPAGAELRLTVTAKTPLMITAAGQRTLLAPEAPWSVALPAYAPGEHELRVEWSAAPAIVTNELRARLMSEDAAATARDLFTTAAPPAPPAAHVIRFRVD